MGFKARRLVKSPKKLFPKNEKQKFLSGIFLLARLGQLNPKMPLFPSKQFDCAILHKFKLKS
jgi:hypothetical protein